MGGRGLRTGWHRPRMRRPAARSIIVSLAPLARLCCARFPFVLQLTNLFSPFTDTRALQSELRLRVRFTNQKEERQKPCVLDHSRAKRKKLQPKNVYPLRVESGAAMQVLP